jgi:lipopolysaccharide export system permease protein
MTSWQIAGSAIRASLILVLLAFALGEWVSPAATEKAQQLKTAAISGGEVSYSKTGFWIKRDNEIIRIGRILDDGQLRNITLYQMSSDAQLIAIIQSARAMQVDGQWFLKNNRETYFNADNIETSQQKSRLWLNPLEQSQINTLTLQPDSLSLQGVVHYLDYLRDNELPTESFELMFWQKIAQPVAIAVMVFLATSFVFGPMRSVSMGARILSGVMLGFAFHLVSQSFGPVSLVYNIMPVIGALLPLALFALLGVWLMRKNS